jgi:hypothetical protein
MLERPKIDCFLKQWEAPKKDIMNARNVEVWVSENDISYFEIDGSENVFMNNLDMIMDIPSITNVW